MGVWLICTSHLLHNNNRFHNQITSNKQHIFSPIFCLLVHDLVGVDSPACMHCSTKTDLYSFSSTLMTADSVAVGVGLTCAAVLFVLSIVLTAMGYLFIRKNSKTEKESPVMPSRYGSDSAHKGVKTTEHQP